MKSLFITLVTFYLILGSVENTCYGASSCSGGEKMDNGRISAESQLYHSKKLQLFDVSALNLQNSAKSNSVVQNNTAISITLNDFDSFTAVGKSWLDYTNPNASFSMNIGVANNSTPQTWSLPANFLTYFNGAGRGDFIAVASVPPALQVAGANKVMRTAYYDENDRPMDVYDHYNFAADGVYHIGSSYDLEVGSDDTFDESDYEVADVPFDLNDNYSSTTEETNHVTNQKTLKKVFTVNVDAFGTITTPTGTYNCLRMLTSIHKYTRPNDAVAYTLVSTTNHVGFLTKTGEYFTAKVSGTSGNVTVSEIEYRTVVQTSLLSEGNDVKLNNDSKGVTINVDNDTAHPSAILDVKSDSLGILIPRIAQANRPSSPATGLMIYQIDNTAGFYYFDGTNWQRLGSTPAPSARLAIENSKNIGGKGRLTNGTTFVKFDNPIENVENIQINIQLEGDCKGVFVSKKTREGFEVKELQKGKSDVEFSWKIISE